MNTIEKNKIIAQFLEISHQKIAMNFHSSWNMLMDVVEKIESLGYRVTIVRHICRIDLTEESKLIISEDIKKIEAVYTVCFKFIQWYNDNNNNNIKNLFHNSNF